MLYFRDHSGAIFKDFFYCVLQLQRLYCVNLPNFVHSNMWWFQSCFLHCSGNDVFLLVGGFISKSKIKPALKHYSSLTRWTAEWTVLQWTALWIFMFAFFPVCLWDRVLEVGLLSLRINTFAILLDITQVPFVGALQLCIPTGGVWE